MKTYPHTFNDWIRDECGPVKHLSPEDIEGYQSPYVTHYNTLREAGWERAEGGKWVHPQYNLNPVPMSVAIQVQRIKDHQRDRYVTRFDRS